MSTAFSKLLLSNLKRIPRSADDLSADLAKSIRQIRAMPFHFSASEFPDPIPRQFQGFNIAIENPAGSVRSGTDKSGKPWSVKMSYDYGFIHRAKGADGEGLDCYIGPCDYAEDVYVVHQNDPTTGKYDEDKVMLGWASPEGAKAAYLENYTKPDFFRSMTIIPVEQFRAMLADSKPGSVHWKKKQGRDHATAAMFAADESGKESSGEGHWVTMGATDGHGGTPVFISKGGEIEKGPADLKGQNVSSIKKPHEQSAKEFREGHPVGGSVAALEHLQHVEGAVKRGEITTHPDYPHLAAPATPMHPDVVRHPHYDKLTGKTAVPEKEDEAEKEEEKAAKNAAAQHEGAAAAHAEAEKIDGAGSTPDTQRARIETAANEGAALEARKGAETAAEKTPNTQGRSPKAAKPAAPAKPFSRAGLEQELVDAYESDKGELDVAADQAMEHYVPNKKGAARSGETRAMIEQGGGQGRFARKVGNAEDVRGEIGERKFEAVAERLGQSRQEKVAAAIQQAKNHPDPLVRFKAALYEAIPPENRAKSPNQEVDTAKLPEGTELTIHGIKETVTLDDEGKPVLRDEGKVPDLPIAAAGKLAVDKGSLRQPSQEEMDEREAMRHEGGYSLPDDEPFAPEPPQAPPTAIKKGLYGNEFIEGSGIGQQKPLFHQPSQYQPPAAPAGVHPNALKPENTASMFPKRPPGPLVAQPDTRKPVEVPQPTPESAKDAVIPAAKAVPATSEAQEAPRTAVETPEAARPALTRPTNPKTAYRSVWDQLIAQGETPEAAIEAMAAMGGGAEARGYAKEAQQATPKTQSMPDFRVTASGKLKSVATEAETKPAEAKVAKPSTWNIAPPGTPRPEIIEMYKRAGQHSRNLLRRLQMDNPNDTLRTPAKPKEAKAGRQGAVAPTMRDVGESIGRLGARLLLPGRRSGTGPRTGTLLRNAIQQYRSVRR